MGLDDVKQVLAEEMPYFEQFQNDFHKFDLDDDNKLNFKGELYMSTVDTLFWPDVQLKPVKVTCSDQYTQNSMLATRWND